LPVEASREAELPDDRIVKTTGDKLMIRSLQRRRFGIGAAGVALATALPGWLVTAGAQTVDEIKKKGELTVGVLVDFPPYGTVNSKNEPDGYDADVARLLAKDWGVKLKLVPVTGPNRIPFLLTDKVDLLIASLAITPERAKQVLFSKPYAAATIVLLAHKNANIKGPADLKALRVGVARASTQDIALTAIAPPGTEIRRFDDDASGMQALMSGQVDALGCSTTVAAQIEKRAPPNTYDEKFVLRQQVMAIAMRPGQTELDKAVNEFIEKNKANGELNKLYEKWLGTKLPPLQTP
jgi:polar amino acid transport system substrate-binding protein